MPALWLVQFDINAEDGLPGAICNFEITANCSDEAIDFCKTWLIENRGINIDEHKHAVNSDQFGEADTEYELLSYKEKRY